MATAPIDEWQTPEPIFADRGQTLPSTSSEPPNEPKRKNVPAAIGRIIGELGLRYRPSAQADLEAHARALKLLTEDVADIPPHLLERATAKWVRGNRFMPKASELIALARSELSDIRRGTDFAEQQLQAHCDRLNAMRMDWHWHVVGEAPNRRVERMR